MAIELTDKVRNLASQSIKKPQLILEIDGIPVIFGAQPVGSLWNFDNGFFLDTDNLFFDQPFENPNSRDYIMLDKTTNNLTQQLEPDKSSSSSVAVQNVQIMDFNKEVTKLFQFGNNVDDILGRNASYYFGFEQGSHPEDSVPIIQGYISEYKQVAGSFIVSIAHPENLKRQDIFVPYNGILTQNLLYKDLLVQDIFYSQRDKGGVNLNILYQTGVLGVEFNRSTNTIEVTITGSTTADQVIELLEADAKIQELVSLELIGTGSNVQTTFGSIPFQIDTTLNVDQTTNLLLSADNVTSLIRVNDELMQVNSKTDTTIDVNRAYGGTASSHESEDSADSVYEISDDPITLALKLYLSSQEKDPYGDAVINAVNQITSTLFVQNAIFLESQDAERDFGIVTGDTAVVSGTLSDGSYTILDIVNVDSWD